MKCFHCNVEFHDERKETYIGTDVNRSWAVWSYTCPACKNFNLFLVNGEMTGIQTQGRSITTVYQQITIWPRRSGRPPCPPEVPSYIAEDYNEACAVLHVSPKASAALSRRCLQNVLRDAAKVKHSHLAVEIQEVLDSGQLRSDVAEVVDAIRHIGNFAAHPTKSTNTGEILPVEEHEAEWNLEILELLFRDYYVEPTTRKKKLEALNEKLKGIKTSVKKP